MLVPILVLADDDDDDDDDDEDDEGDDTHPGYPIPSSHRTQEETRRVAGILI